MEDTRLLIVEDHPLLAETVAMAMRLHGATVEVLHPTCDAQVVDAAHEHAPHLVLLDLDLGGGVSPGHHHVAPLTAAGADVLIVSGSQDVGRVALAIEAGALGYVGKDKPFHELLDHVQRALAGEVVLPPQERTSLLLHLRHQRVEEHSRLEAFTRLSPREQQVLAALMEGRSAEEIAAESFVSLNTVRTQVRGIREKLGVASQLAAVVLAHRAGWRPPTS